MENATFAHYNNSTGHHPAGHAHPPFGDFYHYTRLVEVYLLPFICTFGILGNTLAAATFLQRPLRSTSCSIFLASRSISDNGFLLALFVIWLGGTMDYELNKVLILCKFLLFLTYICGAISVWLVVFVTTENYIRICHPFIVKQLCTTRNAILAIIVLFVVVLSLNHFPLWISDQNCLPSAAYPDVTQAFVYIDTILTLVLPTAIMAFLIASILIRLFQHHKVTRKYNDTVKKHKIKAKSPFSQVPKMLLAVSLAFLILNLPSHVIRIRLLIGSFMKGSLSAPDTEAAIQTLSQLFYYLSLSINVFIYVIFGANFRKTFKETFKSKDSESSNKSFDEIKIDNLAPPLNPSAYDSTENGLISTPMLSGQDIASYQ